MKMVYLQNEKLREQIKERDKEIAELNKVIEALKQVLKEKKQGGV